MILRLVSAACLPVYLASCSSLAPAALPPDSAEGPLRAADEIVVTDISGRAHRVVVTSADAHQVCHDAGCIPAAGIATIERREFSAVKTTILVVSIIALVVGVSYGVAMASLVGML